MGPQAFDTFGYDIRSWYDDNFWLKYLYPEDRQMVLNFYRAQTVVDKGNELEYRMITAKGEIIWIRDMVHLSRDENSCLVLQGIMVNITESVEKEAQLVQAQKMEAVGRLTGGIAHDFNNLLTIIQGNIKLLADYVNTESEEANELIDDALSATVDGAELTERLLAFSRRQSLKPEKVHINDLIEASTRLLRRMVGEDIKFSSSLVKRNPIVFIDPNQFGNALLNLVINARDALTSGGEITIKTGTKRFICKTTDGFLDLNQGDYVTVIVSDNGHGMDSDTLKQACEPFFTTKGPERGSGLGLSMVYGFVNQSGGGIAISSSVGKGTQVTLFLPLAAKSNNAGKPTAHQDVAEELPTGTETVLVVEDEQRLKKFAVRSLKMLGYKVLDAADAPKAMKQLQSGSKIDVLFSDNVLPGAMNGRELADWAVAHRPNLKIVLTTGFTSRNEIGPSVYDGSFPVLKKPYSREELAEYIRAVLDGLDPASASQVKSH